VAKTLKVVGWIAALTLAAAAGAYTASRSDPFPPGVSDPGARPTPSVAAEPAWDLAMRTESSHLLHEGGACRSDWIVTGSLAERPNGALAGDAVGSLEGPAGCDFPQAQVQTRRVTLKVIGTLDGRSVTLAFRLATSSPPGSQDLGGFVATLPQLKPRMRIVDGVGDTTAFASSPDGDLGDYRSASALQLRQ
jgi:hypothetical protein